MVTKHQYEHMHWPAILCEWFVYMGCCGNCWLSDSDQYVCYQNNGSLYEWHCYLPGKNNIFTAVILSTMTHSLLAHENLSCQTVKGGQLFTNIFQIWLQYCCCKRKEREKRATERLKPLPVYWLPLSKRRKRPNDKWEQIFIAACKLVGHTQMQCQYKRGKFNQQSLRP